jgi:putative ABC transport system substrate-binding protein
LVNLIASKQFEVLHETVPKTVSIGFLVNPNNPNAEVDTKEVLTAAHALGRKLLILKASTPGEIDAAFSMLTQQGVGALLFHADAFFRTRNEQLAALTTRNAIPAIFHIREFPAAGGLMSYGAAATDAYRHAGRYAGRILNGERPADLPVQQATKVELVINLKTAKALGVTLSLPLLGRADEVIE